MRHGKKFNHLSRTSEHRSALLRNLAIALIEHKRIDTTLAKARALRKYVEPLITKAKANTTHSRRVVFSYLQNKEAIKELFGPVAAKVADRPGGYVRVIKTGFRRGDGAEMALIELVDFNEVYNIKEGDEGGKKKKRTRRGGSGKAAAATETAVEETAEEVEETVEDVVEEVEDTVEEVAEEVVETAEEVVEEAEEIAEEVVEEASEEAQDVAEETTEDDEEEKDEEKTEG